MIRISFLSAAVLMFLLTACKDEGFFSEPAPAGALSSLSNANKAPEHSLDWINKAQIAPGENTVQGNDIEIVGWAMDPDAKQIASKVYLSVNGSLFTTEYGIAREDVAGYFKNPAYNNCGFVAKFSRSLFKPGIYSIGLVVVGANKSSYFSSPAEQAILLKL